MRKKKLLVVGGTGFLGYHFCKTVKKNYDITVISTKKPKRVRLIKNIKYLTCDISKKQQLKKINSDFNIIFNFGGYVDHKNKKKTYSSHYIGTKNLVDIFKKRKIELFVQMGSCLEYGNIKSPQTEKTISNPISNYAISKYLASRYLLKHFKKLKFPCVIVRAYQIYGPKQDLNRLIPIVIDGCLKNKKFDCSEGSQYRDFLHVNDFTKFLKGILKYKKNIHGEVFNVGLGKPYKVKNLILKIKKITKKGYPNFGKIKLRDEELKTIYPSIRKAKKLLKWKPKIDIKKGIRTTINSYI